MDLETSVPGQLLRRVEEKNTDLLSLLADWIMEEDIISAFKSVGIYVDRHGDSLTVTDDRDYSGTWHSLTVFIKDEQGRLKKYHYSANELATEYFRATGKTSKFSRYNPGE